MTNIIQQFSYKTINYNIFFIAFSTFLAFSQCWATCKKWLHN